MSATFLRRAALLLNATLAVYYLGLWLSAALSGQHYLADMRGYYLGLVMVYRGDGQRLYDRGLHAEYERAWLTGRGLDAELLPYNPPPHFTVPLGLAGALPFEAVFYGWAALQAGLLVLLLRWLLELLDARAALDRALVIATVLGFMPVFLSFQLGQQSLLLATCLLGFARALERGRAWPAAAWLVLGTVKPQLVLVPAVVVLAGRRWGVLLRAAGLFLAWAAITSAVLGGPRIWLDFAENARGVSRLNDSGAVLPWAMFNLKAVLVGVLGAERFDTANVLAAAALLLALGWVGWLWSGPWPADAATYRLRLALSLQVGLLANPHLNPADVVVFAVPAAMFYASLPEGGWRRAAGLALCAWPAVFYVDFFARSRWPGNLRPFTVVLGVLAGVMMATSLRRSRKA